MDRRDPNPARTAVDAPLLTRRSVLAGGVAVTGIGLLAACSSSGGSPAATPPPGGGLVALADVPVGGAVVAKTADGAEVVVAQPEAGRVVAFSAICTHMGCSVKPDGAALVCPCHGSVFQLATGEVTSGPAEEPLPPVAVKIDGDRVVEA